MSQTHLNERFYEAIAVDITRKKRKAGLHVSDLFRDCLRCSYYEKKLGRFLTPNTILNFWRGQRLHETPCLKHHELELEWSGIHGTIDEYEDGTLLDKKTVWEIPKEPSPQHIRQLEYYSVLLRRNRYPVTQVQILYIALKDNKIQLFTIKPRTQKEIEREILTRKTVLLHDTLPQRNLNDPYCGYCAYGLHCFTNTTV